MISKDRKHRILAFNLYHDSGIAYIEDGKLIASLEGEKDSRPRFYSEATLIDFADLYARLERIAPVNPQVVACLGEYSKWKSSPYSVYYGIDHQHEKKASFFGKDVTMFSTTHEKAHIFCSYALSPFRQGRPVYVLTYEGGIGKMYKIDENLNIINMGTIIKHLGYKYEFLFILAGTSKEIHANSPGKSMALAAFAKERNIEKYRESILWLLYQNNDYDIFFYHYNDLKEEYYQKFGDILPYNKGAESQHYKEFAYAFQAIVFEEFYKFAKLHCTEKLPLLIGGGCGLNCDWNQLWKKSDLFSDVFVPPCTNDSGIAIGIGAEAQYKYTGEAKLEWTVYAGEKFLKDQERFPGYNAVPLDYKKVAEFLAKDKIIAWVQGRYEIGPRALCNRSLIASAEKKRIWDRLNFIKQREEYRPIAPVCIEENTSDYFYWTGPSPYMLFFQNVKSKKLKAVTHVDNSARIQTVRADQNSQIYTLLREMKDLTGYSVLCNTSLNFHGKGFINKSSDLYNYAKDRRLDGFVIEDIFYMRDELSSIKSIPATFEGDEIIIDEKSSKIITDKTFTEGVECPVTPVNGDYICILEIKLIKTIINLDKFVRIDLTAVVEKDTAPWVTTTGERHSLSLWIDSESSNKISRDISYDDIIEIPGENLLFININIDFDKEKYPQDFITSVDKVTNFRFMYFSTKGKPGKIVIKDFKIYNQI